MNVPGYIFLRDDSRNVTSATVEQETGTALKLYFRAKQVTVTWLDEDGTTVLDGPKTFNKGETEPAQTIKNPTKAEDNDYTYEFDGWIRFEDGDGNVTYTASYKATPVGDNTEDPTPTPVPVTPAPTVTPTPVSTVTPEIVELPDNPVPLANREEQEEEPEIVELEDTAVPLASGNGGAWALLNFALMNLAAFESLMLLIGYFIKTKGISKEEKEEKKKKLKKKGIMRVISLPVAVVSIIVFCLTEDITLPTAIVDKYTLLMALIAIVQTVVVALSRKEVKVEEEKAKA